MDSEEIASTLRAMLSQEQDYSCHDYILEDDHPDIRWLMWRVSLLTSEELTLNRNFRTRMVTWAYEVVRFSKFHRETVEFATSYFDRFLQTQQAKEALRDFAIFQLAFITCFYMATKLHEPVTMSPAFFSVLSKDKFSMQQIEQMEFIILSALQWRMNPPTALSFARHLIALHPLSDHNTPSMRDAVFDLAKVQIELTVDDYRFVSIPKSTIALAALVNALESLQVDQDGRGIGEMMRIAHMKKDLTEVLLVCNALYGVISKLPHQVAKCLPKALSEKSCRGQGIEASHAYCQSPRSVLYRNDTGNTF